MPLRQKLFTIFIWLSVINLSIWVGGTLFHMIVVLPIWSQPLPGSVKDFFGGTRAYEYLLDFYGPKWMVIRILPVIISLLLAWYSKRHRILLLVTVLEGSSAEEITQLVKRWILADRIRFAIIFI